MKLHVLQKSEQGAYHTIKYTFVRAERISECTHTSKVPDVYVVKDTHLQVYCLLLLTPTPSLHRQDDR